MPTFSLISLWNFCWIFNKMITPQINTAHNVFNDVIRLWRKLYGTHRICTGKYGINTYTIIHSHSESEIIPYENCLHFCSGLIIGREISCIKAHWEKGYFTSIYFYKRNEIVCSFLFSHQAERWNDTKYSYTNQLHIIHNIKRVCTSLRWKKCTCI